MFAYLRHLHLLSILTSPNFIFPKLHTFKKQSFTAPVQYVLEKIDLINTLLPQKIEIEK